MNKQNKYKITMIQQFLDTSGYVSKRIELMFVTVSFTIAQSGKQPPSMDEWITKMWPVHPMEYYSALKRNEILKTWMSVKDFMLIEVSQSQKDKYCLVLCI
jgi:hypothetical protein